jgi:deoxyribose-phosphate aldolase
MEIHRDTFATKAQKMAFVLGNFDEAILDPTINRKQFEDWMITRGNAGFRHVCIPLTFVKYGREMIVTNAFDTNIITVIGFPHGNEHSTADKASQIIQAARSGASEVDFVINISLLRSDPIGFIEELRGLSQTAHRNAVHIKAIFETYYLSNDEIRAVASMCEQAGIDTVKTSTGFAVKGKNHKERDPEQIGATIDAIELMGEGVKDKEKVGLKPSGGIRTLESLTKLREAWRKAGWKDAQVKIGSSSGLQILEELKE